MNHGILTVSGVGSASIVIETLGPIEVAVEFGDDEDPCPSGCGPCINDYLSVNSEEYFKKVVIKIEWKVVKSRTIFWSVRDA